MHNNSESPDALHIAYITCANQVEAETIGRHLVEERLAACVNIIPGMMSLYRWEGKIESAQEVVVLAKTTQANVTALQSRVLALHSYSVPCVIILPITSGSPAYMAWLRDACRIKTDES